MSMRTMAAGVAMALAAAPGHAADRSGPVATLKVLEGNVLVSGEAGLASAEASARLVEGSRVITTANARVLVVYDDGCEVQLEPNQRLAIERGKPCRERLAQAESILREPEGMLLAGGTGAAGGAAAAALAGTLGPGIGLAAGAAGAAVIAAARGERNTSPN